MFKITIVEIIEEEYIDTKTELVEERHYTDEELNDHYRWTDGDAKSKMTKRVFGPVTTTSIRKKERTVLVQEVEDLAIKAIISAINGI